MPSRRYFAAVLAVLALLGMTAPAGASARLLDSSPDDRASLAALDLITFEFDSLLAPVGAEITVTKLDGTVIPVGPASVDGSILSASVIDSVPSGNYAIAYLVQSADGDENSGSIQVSVNAPEQALSGGLFVVIAIAVAMFGYLAFVFRVDQRRRRR